MSKTELGLDIETTGLLDPDHRIIEIYLEARRDGKTIFTYEQRFDPQRAITAEAQRVHGISYTDLIGKPTFDSLAPTIQAILARFDVHIAHNGVSFDMPFLKKELERCGLVMPEKPIVDTMLEGLWATPDGKKPNLSELCFATGIVYDPSKAHAAEYDVRVMLDAYDVGRKLGFFPQPGESVSLAA